MKTLNREKRQFEDMNEQIHIWENELLSQGFVSEEKPLFQAIKMFDEHKEQSLFSKLLTFAAWSRIGTSGYDSIAKAWLNKAVDIDRDNVIAKNLIFKHEQNIDKNLFAMIDFPTIRETDNRPAKKKAAEDYIDICRRFLDKAEQQQDQLSTALKADLELIKNNESLYKKAIEIVDGAIKEAALLLRAAEDYEQSISGVFYTSTYFQDMKQSQTRLEESKVEWESLFQPQKQEPESALQQLSSMIGLESVKERVNSIYQFLKYQNKRKSLGFQTKDSVSLNMILTGNPGTGKTTLARLFAKIYHELNLLPRSEVIEADRSQLVGAYIGQTEENVRSVVERALGGVLFIDEAYSLKREGQSGNDYGQTAIDTLVSLMTSKEYGGRFAVILAGYPEEMRAFLEANPGLRSRFPQSNHLSLQDYTTEELTQIAEKIAAENDYTLTKDAKIAFKARLEKERVDETFGNARSARDIILNAIFKKGSQHDDGSIIAYTTLEEEDFEVYEEKIEVNPVEKLESLIGLESVKKEVSMLASFVRMQQMRRAQELPVVPIQLHAVFTGNPGTGKTTVAKIYAELLKECGMLKRGHLIISSRADFVAGYVGQTAIKTKKKIREALGGVLFIDEAYSLLGQSAGDFGKEVIDTLVDEMTKHNENLVVVLAGYPNEMEILLDSNPGLRSRFKKFISFQDYSSKEMIEIMKSYAGKFKYHLSTTGEEFLQDILLRETFEGNGRFATNLVDDAIQAQALRLLSLNEFNEEQANLLEIEDLRAALNKQRKGEN